MKSTACTKAPIGDAKLKRASPKRTSTGAIGLKKLRTEEGGPSYHPGKKKSSLVTPLGNVVYHSYTTTSSKPPSDPLPSPHFTIKGVRKPEGGYGKVLIPKLTPKEKEQAQSSCQPLRIQQVWMPTMVWRPPVPFEGDEEVEVKPKVPTIASLSAKIINLCEDVRILRGSLAESYVKIRDLEDDINTLRLGIGT